LMAARVKPAHDENGWAIVCLISVRRAELPEGRNKGGLLAAGGCGW
jgi:hypothetical protein